MEMRKRGGVQRDVFDLFVPKVESHECDRTQ